MSQTIKSELHFLLNSKSLAGSTLPKISILFGFVGLSKATF